MNHSLTVAGIALDIEMRGTGRPLLFLHPGEGLQPHRPWLDLLSQRYRVIAPHHPGWGNSALPNWCSSVDDRRICISTWSAHWSCAMRFWSAHASAAGLLPR